MRHRLDRNPQIDPIEQRPGQPLLVAATGERGATAQPRRLSTWARVRGQDEQESGRIANRSAAAMQDDPAALDGLSKCLEDRRAELRHLVQEEDAAMCE